MCIDKLGNARAQEMTGIIGTSYSNFFLFCNA